MYRFCSFLKQRSNNMKKILGLILGAGAGWIGTAIRVALAGVAGYFINKGWIDSAVGADLVEKVVGIALVVLASLGSYLNSEVQLNKTPPSA
jgi:hypothetical protein